jgi:hypothetical protein
MKNTLLGDSFTFTASDDIITIYILEQPLNFLFLSTTLIFTSIKMADLALTKKYSQEEL